MIWGCSGVVLGPSEINGVFSGHSWPGVIRERVGVFWGWVICGDGEEAVDGGLGGWQG